MHQFVWILKRQGDLFNLLQKGGGGGGGEKGGGGGGGGA